MGWRFESFLGDQDNAEWSSQSARLAHNQEVAGAEPASATKPIEWRHNTNEKSEARNDCRKRIGLVHQSQTDRYDPYNPLTLVVRVVFFLFACMVVK